jgi:hypothetical protein
MAFSVSPQQTVLWDQIQYSGSPSDFAWVLPVRAGAQIQLSHDAFFEALDALTSPVITRPTPSCAPSGSGFGCGSASASGTADFASGFGGSGGGSGVQVLSQSVVGPYDTVTLHSTQPDALRNWLTTNGYDIPASIQPVVDAYVSEGFDFIALRLAPGQGVQAMQPVRVVMPGASLALPLRMVAAGAGVNVGITLYVISGGRYQAQNFPNGTVDPSKLVWLHTQDQSNYESLAETVMQGGGGRTWLTEFAQETSLSGTPDDLAAYGGYSCGSPGAAGVSLSGSQSLPALYFSQCLCLGVACPQVRRAFASPFDASGDAVSDAVPDAPGDAPSDAAHPGDAASDASGSEDDGGQGDGGGLDSPDSGECTTAACDGFDDLSVAAVGLDPASTWVTRMRVILPSSALATDLVLEAAPAQAAVSNQLSASVYDDPSYSPCPSSGGACAATDGPPLLTGRVLVAGALGLLAAALVRRRKARRGGR